MKKLLFSFIILSLFTISCAKEITLVECDDGSFCPDGYKCIQAPDGSWDCANQGCGNNIPNLEQGEECDLGIGNSNLPDRICRENCIWRNCGDAIIDTVTGEECDDGTPNDPRVLNGEGQNSNTAPDSCRYVLNPDFLNPSDGPEYLCVSAYCGDGVQDFGEACDQGTLNASKLEPLPEDATGTCTPSCALSTCGDDIINTSTRRIEITGITEQSLELCDNGNANSQDPSSECRADCTLPICGDDITDASLLGEECDAGASNSDTPNVCRENCTLPFCGDNIRDDAFPTPQAAGGEQCDDGTILNGQPLPNTCREGCTVPTCGDGIVDDGTTYVHEECDMGTGLSDGCINCVIQPGWSCAATSLGSPSICNEGCGDGTMVGSEGCDDDDLNRNP
jgi:hypothetical protein